MRDHKLQCMSLVTTLVLATTLSWSIPRAYGKRLPSQGGVYERLKVFTEALSYLESNYVDEIDAEAVMAEAIRGMMKVGDPEGAFIPPDVYKEMQAETQGRHAGVGLEMTIRDDRLTIVAPIEGTPAFHAGIQPGDQLVKVDGASTKEMTLIEAVRKLRGAEGTPVTISILRPGFTAPKDLTLTRVIIAIHSVRWTKLQDDIGYIKLRSFPKTTAEELEEALADLDEQNIRALVLDLRNNPGGLLEQAIAVADQFLAGGQLIVSTKGRLPNQNMKGFAKTKAAQRTYPMIVLVNKGSAAASEIVAGALQDLKRALILGTPTFGKGSIQTIIPLSDGSGLRLTTARYFTPQGRSIHGTGLTPDIVVEPPPSPGDTKPEHRSGWRTTLAQWRDTLFQWLPFRTPPPAQKSAEPGASGQSGAQSLGDPSSDIQLQRAVEILKTKRF